MAKIKTHKASAKRFRVTAGGKIKVQHSQHRHNLGIKTPKRKRTLRKTFVLGKAMTANIRSMIQK